MIKFSQIAALLGAFFALPGVAHAGSVDTTSTATFHVIDMCSVRGRTVYLGTFSTQQTWGDVGRELGYYDGISSYFNGVYQLAGFKPGNKGFDYAEWGSVLCTNGVPYNLKITGSAGGYIRFPGNGYDVLFMPMVKSVDGQVLSDSSAEWPGQGKAVNLLGVDMTGTGTEQFFHGGAYMFHYADLNERLTPGVKVDTLTYSLNF